MVNREELVGMAIFQATTSLKSRGFTLVELLVVILLLSIFLTFASVNWNIPRTEGREKLLEDLSIGISLLKEAAVAGYEDKVIEFDIGLERIATGTNDEKEGFLPKGEIGVPKGFHLKDVVINGQSCALGKCYMFFHPGGLVDRVIIHFEEDGVFYSILVNPLTAWVSGEKGYIEEKTPQ
jgi:prepilin-type N-terminal cleavage/methylation domain-containing protein